MKPCREPELRRQLRTIVRVWEGRQGRESAKLAVLSTLAEHFGDLGDPELVTENRRLRQQLKALLESWPFEAGVNLIILANALLIGVELSWEVSQPQKGEFSRMV